MSKNTRVGRPEHDYWMEGEFEKIPTVDGKPKAKCKHCDRIYANTAKVRLMEHR